MLRRGKTSVGFPHLHEEHFPLLGDEVGHVFFFSHAVVRDGGRRSGHKTARLARLRRRKALHFWRLQAANKQTNKLKHSPHTRVTSWQQTRVRTVSSERKRRMFPTLDDIVALSKIRRFAFFFFSCVCRWLLKQSGTFQVIDRLTLDSPLLCEPFQSRACETPPHPTGARTDSTQR